MSGVKHTPGPWRIDVNGSENWTVDYEGPSSTFMTICANGRREPVGFAVEPTAWRNDDEIEANARLIASAPDLLEALGQLLGNAEIARFHLKDTEEGMIVGSALFDTIQQARAAIARARGEQDGGGE